MASLEGRVLGGCKLIRKIGAGGSGEVYLGEQMRVGNRPVAVKIVSPDGMMTPEQTETMQRRFEREAALLGQFSHPNILPVHDSGVEDGLLYLVMQYAPAGSLSDAIRGRSDQTLTLPAGLDFTTDIVSQVAAALEYTHERGVVHRDVKPGNVLIRVEPGGHWHALLADFGVARPQETTSEKTQVTGTFAYMAPEQFSGQFSPASDQYALGVMTYQLLTGHTPFEGDLAMVTHGHMYDTPPSMRLHVAAMPAAVDAVVLRALSKDPAKRYSSVAAYADALRAAAASAPPESVGGGALPATGEATPPSTNGRKGGEKPPAWPLPQPPKQPGLARTWIVVLAAALLLVALIGGAGFITAHKGSTSTANGTTPTINTGATQTSQAATAQAGTVQANAQGTANARGTATAAAQSAAQQTAAAATAQAIPSASATAGVGDNMTSPPPPPQGAGTLLWGDPAPKCDKTTLRTWTVDNATGVQCDTNGNPTLTAQNSNALACIEQQSTNVGNGYFSTIVAPQNGPIVLGVRESSGPTSNNATSTKGYLIEIDATKMQYAVFADSGTGQPTSIGGGQLPTALAQSFAVGVQMQGAQLTLYINGNSIGQVTDPHSSFSSGWVALCTQGTATYSDVQVYQAS